MRFNDIAACFSLLFLLITQPVLSQQIGDRVILEKLGRKKRIVYYEGDPIRLKLRDKSREFSGTLEEIYREGFMVGDVYVPLEDIDWIRTEHTEGFLSPGNGPKLVMAAIGLFLVDQLNHSLIQGQPFRVPMEIGAVSGGLVVTGLVWSSFRYRRFRPGENRRIRIFLE